MTQIEQIKAEIERRIEQFKEERSKVHPTTPKSVDRLSLGARIAALEETLVFIQSLPVEQQSNRLDKFIQSLLETYPTNKNEVPIEALNDYHQGLICGARKTYNWILESAIDGCYIKRNRYTKVNVLNGLSVTCDPIQKFKDGDKVKVIIVKEDEQ